MTATTMSARPGTTPPCGRCRGGGWPGSPGGSTASRWPAWPRCSALLAVYLLFTGMPMHHAYAAVLACHPASSLACRKLSVTSTAPVAASRRRSPGGVLLQCCPR